MLVTGPPAPGGAGRGTGVRCEAAAQPGPVACYDVTLYISDVAQMWINRCRCREAAVCTLPVPSHARGNLHRTVW